MSREHRVAGQHRLLDARWLAARLALLVTVVLVIELLSAVLYLVLTGHWFSYQRPQARRAQICAAAAATPSEVDDRPAWIQQDEGAIHPYVGFVLDPNHPRAAGVHPYGFHDIGPILEPPDSSRLVVVITGGSVAGQLWEARAPIAQALRDLPANQGKQIIITRIALGGFMQPQQCLALSYLLALGGHVDLVINLDGFNEIVLPWCDNARAGVFPFYPRAWYGRTGNIADAKLVREAGAITVLTDLRQGLAARLSGSPGRWSVTANLLWVLTDALLQRRLAQHQQAAATLGEHPPYFRTGPPGPFHRDQVLHGSARLWANASINIQALARQYGFDYLHCLQPNQYLAGSKPLSAEEQREAYRLDRGYGPAARDGYPLLVEAGQLVAAAGVRYHDLTMIFADEHRTVYGDACCHLTPLGKELLAEQVAAIVTAELLQ